jgi:hypothetical protein
MLHKRWLWQSSFCLVDTGQSELDINSVVQKQAAASNANLTSIHGTSFFCLITVEEARKKVWEGTQWKQSHLQYLFKSLSRTGGVGIYKIKLISNLNKQWPDPPNNEFQRLFQWLQKLCNGVEAKHNRLNWQRKYINKRELKSSGCC